MNAKLAAGAAAAAAAGIIIAAMMLPADPAETRTERNAKLGLVINSPHSMITIQELDEIYRQAASADIGRSNVYMFWNLVEPEREKYDWKQYDRLMGLNEKNGLRVTLYFSVINAKSLGPFPEWIGNPNLRAIPEDRLVDVLDAVLSRYHIVDSLVISAGTDEHFRFGEQNIPAYEELFGTVYGQIKERHPHVRIGNSFELHNTLNKNLQDTVRRLSFGDFVAFTYMPVDALNEVNRTPEQAIGDLEAAWAITDKPIAFLETSYSTSEFTGGSAAAQAEFIGRLYDFYGENRDGIEFLTWYRLYDRPDGTCSVDESDLEGSTALGNSTFVIQRLGSYVCNAGLLTVDGEPKPGWGEFSDRIGPG